MTAWSAAGRKLVPANWSTAAATTANTIRISFLRSMLGIANAPHLAVMARARQAASRRDQPRP